MDDLLIILFFQVISLFHIFFHFALIYSIQMMFSYNMLFVLCTVILRGSGSKYHQPNPILSSFFFFFYFRAFGRGFFGSRESMYNSRTAKRNKKTKRTKPKAVSWHDFPTFFLLDKKTFFRSTVSCRKKREWIDFSSTGSQAAQYCRHIRTSIILLLLSRPIQRPIQKSLVATTPDKEEKK